MNTTFDTI